MEDHVKDLEFAELAYDALLNCDPDRLQLVAMLLAEGETPETIHERMKKMRPDFAVLPEMCAGAAQWMIHQKANN